ncbi:MAG TPA: glycosyltransferase family 1 protein [Polyangium sp.]|nr:glycosyltransferase family 1 protein [Polyangium sp.]
MQLILALGGTDYGQSGIGVYTRAIIPRLRRALEMTGDELVVFGTPKDIHSYAEIVNGVRHLVISPLFTRPGPNAAFHLVRAASILAHQSASVLLLPAANRRVLIHSPIPTVSVVHDLAQLHVARKYDALRMIYFRHLLLPTLRRAAHIVAVSESTKSDLLTAFNCPSLRISVIPNGVDTAKFAPPSPNEPRNHKSAFDSPYVLYLGRLEHPGKNHVRLVQAFAASELTKNHSLVLAGADWGARARIQELVTHLGISGRVHFTGFVPDKLVPKLVAGADVVAMVGLREGFGLPALEALAAGRPLLVSNTGALTEVTGNLAVHCNPFDCNSIRSALEKAISDPEVRRRANEEGPRWAREYDWDKTAASLLAICRAVALEPLQRRAECTS